jgi:hypothetical protein
MVIDPGAVTEYGPGMDYHVISDPTVFADYGFISDHAETADFSMLTNCRVG